MINNQTIRSLINTIQVFRSFFPLKTIIKESLLFLFSYKFTKGSSLSLPPAITFLLTKRCNLTCSFCFIDQKGKSLTSELSLNDIKKFVSTFPPKYKPGIFLCGGEPLLNKELIPIFNFFKEQGMKVGIITNGLLLNIDLIKDLSTASPDIMIFSFMGPEKIHNQITKNPNSFKTIAANIKNYQENCPSSKVIYHYILHRFNFSAENIDQFITDCLEQKLKIKNIRFLYLSFLTESELKEQESFWQKNFPDLPSPNYNIYLQTDNNFAPSEKELDIIFDYLKQNSNHYNFTFKPFLSKKDIISWYLTDFTLNRNCLFPWASLQVNADGKVFACQNIEFPIGSIKTDSLKQIWNNNNLIRFRQKLKKGLFPGCARCCKL